MDLAIIFWAIMVIAAVSLSFILIKGILKAAMISLAILFLVFALFTFFIIKDTLDLKDNLMSGDKLMVLKDNGKTLVAFSFKNLTETAKLKNEDTQSVRESAASGDFSLLTKKYYKIFVFEYRAFNESLKNGINYEAEGKETALSKEDVNEILNSDAALEQILKKTSQHNELSEAQKEQELNEFMNQINITSQDEIKSYIFAMMIADLIKDKGPAEMISSLKRKDITVYPNTALFRAIKLLPSFVIEKLASKMAAPAGG